MTSPADSSNLPERWFGDDMFDRPDRARQATPLVMQISGVNTGLRLTPTDADYFERRPWGAVGVKDQQLVAILPTGRFHTALSLHMASQAIRLAVLMSVAFLCAAVASNVGVSPWWPVAVSGIMAAAGYVGDRRSWARVPLSSDTAAWVALCHEHQLDPTGTLTRRLLLTEQLPHGELDHLIDHAATLLADDSSSEARAVVEAATTDWLDGSTVEEVCALLDDYRDAAQQAGVALTRQLHTLDQQLGELPRPGRLGARLSNPAGPFAER